MVALPLAKISRPDLLPLQIDAPEPSVIVIGIGDVDQIVADSRCAGRVRVPCVQLIAADRENTFPNHRTAFERDGLKCDLRCLGFMGH